MNVPARLVSFGAVLAVGFFGAAALGAAVGPIDVGGEEHGGHAETTVVVTDPPQCLSITDAAQVEHPEGEH